MDDEFYRRLVAIERGLRFGDFGDGEMSVNTSQT